MPTAARGGSRCARKTKHTEAPSCLPADGGVCNACPLKAQCTTSDHGRRIRRSFYEAYLDRVRGYHATEAYPKAMRKRKVWVEPLFAEAKEWHGLRRFRLRGLEKVNGEADMVWIPGGTFLMGSDDHYPEERPRTR